MKNQAKLLDFDLGASFFELLLDLLGLVLGNRFLERLRSGFDKILGLLETETGEFADDLDDADLLRGIETGEDAAAFMLCGAKAVMVGTANFTDPFACPRIIRELDAYCDRQNVRSAQELVGTLAEY